MEATATIRALARGLDVLKIIQSSGQMSLAQLHGESGIAKPTLLRILKTLCQGGFVRRGLSDGLYYPGVLITEVDEFGERVAQRANPVMSELCAKVAWASDLSIFDGEGMRIIESTRHITPYALRRIVVGLRVSLLFSAMGRAYLSACPARKRGQILEQTKSVSRHHNAIARNPNLVDEIVSETRKAGYAVREPYVHADGLNAIAIAVRVAEEPVGAINLLWLDSAMTCEEATDRFLGDLREAAVEIGHSLESESAGF